MTLDWEVDTSAEPAGRQGPDVPTGYDYRERLPLAGGWIVGQRIVYGLRKNTLALLGGGYRRENRVLSTLEGALVIYEEERLVLYDWAAVEPSELIAPKQGIVRRTLEEIPGVHCFIAEKLKDTAMIFVCAGFDDYVYDAANVAAKFRRVVTCLNFELLDGIHAWRDNLRCSALRGLLITVVVHAVEQIVVVGNAHPAGRESAESRTWRGDVRAGGEQRELEVIAAVQGKVYDLFAVHNLTSRGLRSLEQRGRRADGDRFRSCANVQRKVDANFLLNLHPDSRACNRLEPWRVGSHGVYAGAERGRSKVPARSCLGLNPDVGVLISERDRRIRYASALRV